LNLNSDFCKSPALRGFYKNLSLPSPQSVITHSLDLNNTNVDVYADSAYRSAEQEQKFADDAYRSKVHHKGKRDKPLSEFKQKVNKGLSKIRAKVEHVFGNQMMVMGGKLMRCIGIARAKTVIGLSNLVYNMNRFMFLNRQKNELGIAQEILVSV
jgi:IS5 family transposase